MELVVGAGPAGAAYVLRRQALAPATALRWICAPRPPGPRAGESLPPDVPPLLSLLGVRHALQTARPSAGAVSAWTEPTPGCSDFMVSGLGPGFQLDRERFESALVDAARMRGCAPIEDPLQRLERVGGGLRFTLRSGASGVARRVIDATGRRAVVASALGVRRVVVDRQVAVLARARLSAEVDRIHIEASPVGWWYLGPVPGDRSAVLALFSDSDLVRRHELARPAPWRAALEESALIRPLLAQPPALLSVVGASSGALSQAAGPDWIAIGDAALSFDPLSSAGIGKALASGIAAAEERSGDAEAWTERQHRTFEAYLDQRRDHYARVRRFDGPYWRRRRAPLRLAPDAAIPPLPAQVRDLPLGPRERALIADGGTAVQLMRRLGGRRRHLEALQTLAGV